MTEDHLEETDRLGKDRTFRDRYHRDQIGHIRSYNDRDDG